MVAIVPKLCLDPELNRLPVIFFMGPDLGGGGWQRTMYERVRYHADDRKLGEFVAAIPCRYGPGDPMMQFVRASETGEYEYQLPWERDLIERAALTAHRGCVLCWLPEESTTEPRTDGESYARDTRGEIGEIRGWMRHDKGVRFVLGAEPKFPGLNVIVRNFSYVVGGSFPVYDTIDDIARGAVRVAKHSAR